MTAATKTILLLLSCLMISGGALAQETKQSREREALRRTQQQLQQAQQELAASREKLLTAEHDSEAGHKELQSVKSRAHSEGLKATQLQSSLDEAHKQIELVRTEKAGLDQRLEKTAADLARTQRELAQATEQARRLQTELTGRTRDIGSCESKNAALYKSGRELIEQCRIQAIDGTSPVRYPATGMNRVAVENMLESYRDKLDEQKIINLK